jgi:hypothetical protein
MLFEVEGVIGFALILLWVYCIFDVISTEEFLVRGLPKMVWLFIVIVLPDIGSIAWLLLGRPEFAGWRHGDTAGRPVRRVVGPEDRQDFAPQARLADPERLQAWEADLQRREKELGRPNPEDPPPTPPMTW